MAKFLNNIDLVGNEIQNVVLQPLGAVPSSNVKVGRKFFDTTEGREKIYDGSIWKLVAYLSDLEALNEENATILEEIEAVRASVEALNKALNEDDTEGIINTWAEIQSLVKAFEEGTDLSAILAEINSTVQANDRTLGALEERTSELETKVENLEGTASAVTVTPIVTGGTPIASITVGETTETLYIPREIKKYLTTITGDGSTTTFQISHGMATSTGADITISVWDISETEGELVMVDVQAITSNKLLVKFAIAPANGHQYRVCVIG